MFHFEEPVEIYHVPIDKTNKEFGWLDAIVSLDATGLANWLNSCWLSIENQIVRIFAQQLTEDWNGLGASALPDARLYLFKRQRDEVIHHDSCLKQIYPRIALKKPAAWDYPEVTATYVDNNLLTFFLYFGGLRWEDQSGISFFADYPTPLKAVCAENVDHAESTILSTFPNGDLLIVNANEMVWKFSHESNGIELACDSFSGSITNWLDIVIGSKRQAP